MDVENDEEEKQGKEEEVKRRKREEEEGEKKGCRVFNGTLNDKAASRSVSLVSPLRLVFYIAVKKNNKRSCLNCILWK